MRARERSLPAEREAAQVRPDALNDSSRGPDRLHRARLERNARERAVAEELEHRVALRRLVDLRRDVIAVRLRPQRDPVPDDVEDALRVAVLRVDPVRRVHLVVERPGEPLLLIRPEVGRVRDAGDLTEWDEPNVDGAARDLHVADRELPNENGPLGPLQLDPLFLNVGHPDPPIEVSVGL